MLLIVTILAIIVNVLLGLFVYQKSPRNATNQLFFILNLTIVFWSIANYFSLNPPSGMGNLFWIRLVMFFAVSLVAAFLLLMHTFPRESLILKRHLFFPYLGLVIITMAATLSRYVFTASGDVSYTVHPKPGPLMPLFALTVVGSIGLGLLLLIKKYVSAQGTFKAQLRYILLGTAGMFALILSTIFFPVVLLGNSSLVAYSPVYTYPFVAAVAYAIVRHRLLDIRLVVARTVSFTLAIGFLGFIYAYALAAVGSMFSTSGVEIKTVTVSTLLTLLVAFSFPYIRRLLERLTNKIFYKDRYDSSSLLYELALSMASTFNLEDLTHQLLQEMLREMRITKGAFALVEERRIYQVAHEGFEHSPEFEEPKIATLLGQKGTVVFDESPEGEVKEIMRSLDASVSIPLRTEGKDMGILVLGGKLSGDAYSTEDIKLLEIFTPEAAVAIQNAKAYEEIRRFNITLQKEVNQATQDLQVANKRLQELDKLKDDFVSIASHELRTPMTAIRSYVWMALNRSDISLSEKMKKYLSRTLISTERLINLVNDMLNISRIESGRVEIMPKAFDITALVEEVTAEVEAKAKEKELHLLTVNSILPKVFADPDKVHQVLLNLLGNALKFTPNSGTITVSFFSDGNFVEVGVKDSGVGISQEDLPRLFQKFGRLDNSYVAMATSGGTGLGLYICKSLVELMHGKIWARSEGVGKGTTFTFSLPAATPAVLAQVEEYTVKVEGEAKTLEPVAI